MKNQDKWVSSKYVYRNGALIGSRETSELAISSRLIADLVAAFYEKYLTKYASGNLLDLGCGKVPLYIAYKDLVSDVTCVDWENTLHKNEHLDQICDLTKPLPFENGIFDTVILSDVLEHIPVPESLCKEIQRILADNGILIINVPFFYWIHESPYDYHRYTGHELKRMMKNAGLEILVLEAIGGSPEVFTDMFAKHIQAVPVAGIYMASFAQWLAARFIRTNIGKRISQKTSKVYPLGYFLIARKIQAS